LRTRNSVMKIKQMKRRRAASPCLAEQLWIAQHGALPPIVSFEESLHPLAFAETVVVHTIPARNVPCYMLPQRAYTERTKIFDGKRFRMYY